MANRSDTDPNLLWGLIGTLLDSWEQALHSRDSALQVAQGLPDWKKQYDSAMSDPRLSQYTRNKFSPAWKIFDTLYRSQATGSLLQQLVEEVKKIPN